MWQVRKTESGNFIATCEPIGLASQGKDELDLYLNIHEAVQLVLNDLLKNGQLDGFLRAKGWQATPSRHGCFLYSQPFCPVGLGLSSI